MDNKKKTTYITTVQEGLIIEDKVVIININKDNHIIEDCLIQDCFIRSVSDLQDVDKVGYNPDYYFKDCDIKKTTLKDCLVLATNSVIVFMEVEQHKKD